MTSEIETTFALAVARVLRETGDAAAGLEWIHEELKRRCDEASKWFHANPRLGHSVLSSAAWELDEFERRMNAAEGEER